MNMSNVFWNINVKKFVWSQTYPPEENNILLLILCNIVQYCLLIAIISIDFTLLYKNRLFCFQMIDFI